MKRLSIAVLLLFATSLIGGAFASSCIAERAIAAGKTVQAPSCCALEAGCTGVACLASVQSVGCHADADSVAVTKKPSGTDNLTAPVSTAVLAVVPTAIDLGRSPQRSGPPRKANAISGYGDTYARTGRLLI